MKSRLVWYQHFHKAGGTSIVNLARKNGERLYLRHSNGNPRDSKGKVLPLWHYSESDLDAFVNECIKSGVTFVATEWGLPNIEHLSKNPNVFLTTCLREPLQRFVSSFHYSFYHGYGNARTFEEFSGKSSILCSPNYYCRVLCRMQDAHTPIHETDFLTAKRRLALFDQVCVLETGLHNLGEALGWRYATMHRNKSSFGLRESLVFLRQRRLKPFWRRLRYPKQPPSQESIEWFNSLNIWDNRLYRETVSKS